MSKNDSDLLKKIDTPEYYTSLSDESLIQVSFSLNKEEYPERLKLITAEIKKRGLETSNGEFVVKDRPDLKGVGGWLLFFCITLSFNALAGILLYGRYISVLLEGQDFQYLTIPYYSLGIILSLVSAAAVLLLASESKHALRFIKRLLLCYGLYGILGTALGFYLGSVDSLDSTLLQIIPFLKNQYTNIIYAFIWYAYFENSTRIQNTFPSQTNSPETSAG